VTTATDTELDQATRDELQPPCESILRHDKTATRVLHWHVECEHVGPHDLYCTDCADATVRWVNRNVTRIGCTICKSPVRLLRVEPLR
jgi:hypothetical protein